MPTTEPHSGQERRTRNRSRGIVLRRRQHRPVDKELERRRTNSSDFNIAAALELHLDQLTTRRAMIVLMESWLIEAKNSGPTEHDQDYVQGVIRAIEVMKTAPDPLTAIAILQRHQG